MPFPRPIPVLSLLAALAAFFPLPSPARPPVLPTVTTHSWDQRPAVRPAAPALPRVSSPVDAIPDDLPSAPAAATPSVPVAPHTVVDRHPSGKPWQLIETEHFLIHHDQVTFARRVARLGEAFYDHIAADLPPGTRDRLSPARSAIYVFRKPEHWQAFLSHSSAPAWSASFVRGSALYLQATGSDTASRMQTFAHEMTHLVFHRFLSVQPPLWLHEGLAEYYGASAYRAVRGIGQPSRPPRPDPHSLVPLDALLRATSYPTNPELLQPYYRTAAAFVGFLRHRDAGRPWAAFWPALVQGEPPLPAIFNAYALPTLSSLQAEFDKYAH